MSLRNSSCLGHKQVQARCLPCNNLILSWWFCKDEPSINNSRKINQ